MVCLITLVVFLGIYAYNDPTPYATPGLGCYITEDATNSTTLPVSGTNPINVQARWNTWFVWAFWTYIAGFALAPAMSCLGIFCAEFAAILKSCGVCLIGLASIGVLVVGSIWRFDSAGRICAGENLNISSDSDAKVAANSFGTMYSAGRFLKIYLIIMYCLIGSFCGLCVFILACNERRGIFGF